MQNKKCCKCKVFLSLAQFTKDRSRTDGLSYTCKTCAKKTAQVWYSLNKERVALVGKVWKAKNLERVRQASVSYRKAHPDRLCLATKRWREKNRERIIAYARKYDSLHREQKRARNKRWRDANKDKVKSLNKKWREANTDYHRGSARLWYAQNRKRALKRIVAYAKTPLGKASLARQRAKRKYALRNTVCTLTAAEWREIKRSQKHLCAICLKRKKLTMDHIHPLSKGGHHTKENIQGLCRSCNARKGAKLPHESEL